MITKKEEFIMTTMDDVRFAHFVIVGLILVMCGTTPAYPGYNEKGKEFQLIFLPMAVKSKSV